MNPNLKAILKNLTDQLSNITTRLDHLEAREPQRTHEAPVGVEPEPEFDMPHNPSRAYQEPAYEPNPRRLNHDQVHNPKPRRVLYDQNLREPNQYQLD